ncbi:MAG: HAMP domain-containing histidine kinase [Bacteroidia bacterium]|nr:HAMP domain-containing histidine kinase [Bacteroidia bacterium]
MWWAYSLMKYNEANYNLKIQLLKSNKQTTELKTIEEARSLKFLTQKSQNFRLNNFIINADTSLIKKFIINKFKGKYEIKFNFNSSKNNAEIVVSSKTLKKLSKDYYFRNRSFITETIILIILVSAGILGLYFTVTTLYELHKQQNNFLLSVTHELKTPISSIILISETLQKRILPSEKQNELLGHVIENADRLKDMTENMLTAMQIENKRFFIRKELLNLSEVINDCVNNFSLKNQIISSIEKEIYFMGDRALLKMTFNNIIENAIKYSDNKAIEITLKRDENKIIVIIADHGIGIDSKYHKKVFKKFYRIEDDEIRNTSGSGLGLYIVKQSIKKHKGKIKIEDNKPQGTKVVIELKNKS